MTSPKSQLESAISKKPQSEEMKGENITGIRETRQDVDRPNSTHSGR